MDASLAITTLVPLRVLGCNLVLTCSSVLNALLRKLITGL